MIKSIFYKVLITKIAAKDLKLEQIDMVLVYLYGELGNDKIIYVELPLGYFTNGKNCVILLNSVLYWLK